MTSERKRWRPKGTARTVNLEVHGQDEFLEGYDVFSFLLTQELAELLLERMDRVASLVADDKDVFKVSWWDASGEFYGRDGDAEELAPTGEAGRVEFTEMVVHPSNLHWEAVPKHGDVTIETDSVERKDIEAFLGK